MARLRFPRVVSYILLGLLAIGEPPHARAEDRIGELTATLAASRSEEDRINAVASLARIQDKAALRALVVALQDPSATVRAIAAVGLGTLHHKAAAPALRQTATNDVDPAVRAKAATALAQVNKANGLPAEPGITLASTRATPAAVAPRSRIHVTIRSATDESKGKADRRVRKSHADVLRQTLADEIAASPLLTTAIGDAKKAGVFACQIDISIIRLETRTRGGTIEVEAQLRLTISDTRGKMLSFLSGGARMEVKRKGYNLAYLPQLRKDTIANSVRGLSGKLFEHLRRTIVTS